MLTVQRVCGWGLQKSGEMLFLLRTIHEDACYSLCVCRTCFSTLTLRRALREQPRGVFWVPVTAISFRLPTQRPLPRGSFMVIEVRGTIVWSHRWQSHCLEPTVHCSELTPRRAVKAYDECWILGGSADVSAGGQTALEGSIKCRAGRMCSRNQSQMGLGRQSWQRSQGACCGTPSESS